MHSIRDIWVRVLRRFRTNRFFEIKPPFKGPGWYFEIRGEDPWGPYATLDDAKLVAECFVEERQTLGDRGGREDIIRSESLA